MGHTNTQKKPSSADTVTEYSAAVEHWESGQGDENLADDNEGDEDEEDEDADAEAEEIARRLNDQLWAEINKAQAEAAAAGSNGAVAISDAPISSNASGKADADAVCHVLPDKRVHEALKTIRIILKDIANDSLARSTLSTTLIPGSGVSVLDAFDSAVSSNAIPKEIAKPLSHLLVSLARSDVLFFSLRHSEESSIQLQLGKGKRQRDHGGNNPMNDDDAPPPSKRHSRLSVRAAVPPTLPIHYALHTQLDAASRAIISALTSPATSLTGPPAPPLIASIQFPLHQVFLFAMSAAGPARNMLQEVGGLIQALGVLTGVPIGGPCSSTNGTNDSAWRHPGTSVYPCSFLGCGKTFARLYSLRAHATRVHAAERPYRCTRCPVAFARNHDLKRHERLHEYKAWQCTVCAKTFSRRDALTRHRNTAAVRHNACATADVVEIDVPKNGAGASAAVEDETHRTHIWNEVSDAASGAIGIILEEGELPKSVLVAAHEAVARLHIVLQACIARALGGGSGGLAVASNIPLGHTATATAAMSAVVDTDTTGGQITLASALAQAQAQLSPATGSNSTDTTPVGAADASGMAPLINSRGSSLYGLSPEQTLMLERAIASAASAAQLQAEAEAALEEEEEEEAVEGGPSECEGGEEGQ